jgi:hypothetical protein
MATVIAMGGQGDLQAGQCGCFLLHSFLLERFGSQ